MDTRTPANWQIGLVGYGEVGRILAEDLRARGVRVDAYDLKLDSAQGATLRVHAAQHGVVLAPGHEPNRETALAILRFLRERLAP